MHNYIICIPKSNMAKLFLIGLGLCDEQDLSLRAIDILKNCDSVFSEEYTNVIKEGSMERLRRIIGKDVMILQREQVEGEEIILASAKEGDTALIVPGDPMTATTHCSLLQSAREHNIETKIVHSSSIFTAAPGACGLQIYKMGKTATITYWRKNFEPDSFIDLIKENKERGAHTLCLLDIDKDMGPMKVSTAIDTIKKAQQRKGLRVVDDLTKIFVLWHVGWEDQFVWAGTLNQLLEKQDLDGPAVIIIPEKMHFREEESWNSLR
jgi:diphthine synthase